jgi:hypothetical protein
MATLKQIQNAIQEGQTEFYYSVKPLHYESIKIESTTKELTFFVDSKGRKNSAFHRYIKLDNSGETVRRKDKKRTFLSVAKW